VLNDILISQRNALASLSAGAIVATGCVTQAEAVVIAAAALAWPETTATDVDDAQAAYLKFRVNNVVDVVSPFFRSTRQLRPEVNTAAIQGSNCERGLDLNGIDQELQRSQVMRGH
jgi:hypothetical protein